MYPAPPLHENYCSLPEGGYVWGSGILLGPKLPAVEGGGGDRGMGGLADEAPPSRCRIMSRFPVEVISQIVMHSEKPK